MTTMITASSRADLSELFTGKADAAVFDVARRTFISGAAILVDVAGLSTTRRLADLIAFALMVVFTFVAAAGGHERQK
jgi:hypothetical protein